MMSSLPDLWARVASLSERCDVNFHMIRAPDPFTRIRWRMTISNREEQKRGRKPVVVEEETIDDTVSRGLMAAEAAGWLSASPVGQGSGAEFQASA